MKGRGTRRLWIGVALIALMGAALGPRHPEVAHAATVPSGLPSHFGFGLAAHPDSTGIDGWMPNSGIPFDYAYQYLSGGVNTGSGWETWNTSGQFALYYAQGAASHNYIPVFSYYEMEQSNGTCGSCGEAQKDLSNLNNASVMSSYFANFRLLMQRLGSGTSGGITGFGGTAIVHVEPDLSGFAEQAVLNTSGSCYGYCTAQGNNPSYLTAAVASSGDTDAQGYPNTYQGFNWALLHIRDKYAPNVKLAFHISDWAAGTDIGSSSSSSVNATSLGQTAGSFAAQSGITGLPSGTSAYDLLFNDVLDRDAAYYKYVYGDSSRWWDRQNVTVPNFHRWESYVSAASQATGRSVIVWQVPEGNQYFDTENNTNGHYQDNRAEYFFGHISELVSSGIIGVLFGAGNGGSTVQYDGMGDGVTNPTSFCTTDGTSSGSICNTHTSTVSDDDGGYIRMESQQYYTNPYPLTGGGSSSPTPTATAPAPTPTSTASPSATIAVEGTDGGLWVKHGTAGWMGLGGVLSAAPAVVKLPGGSSLYVVAGSDHTLWERTDSTGWQKLSSFACQDNPAAVVVGSTLTVACQYADHATYTAQTTVAGNTPPGSLSGFSSLGGVTNYGPAVTVVNGALTTFVIGTDSRIWWRTASASWQPLSSVCSGHPAAASYGATAYLACHWSDGSLQYSKNTGTGWGSFVSAGGTGADGPGIAATSGGALFVMQSTNGADLQNQLTTSGTLAGWQSTGGVSLHGAAAG